MEEEIKNLIDKIEEIKGYDNRIEGDLPTFNGKVIGVQTDEAVTKDMLSLVLDTGYRIDLIFKEEE